MARKASTLPHAYPIYTWVADTGENIHIDTQAIRNWCIKRQPKVQLVGIDLVLAKSFIHQNVVNPQRCVQLAIECEAGLRKLDPVIFCLMQKPELDKRGIKYGGGQTPDALLVDGHHRYAMMAMLKQPTIPGHVLTVHQWARFRIIDDRPAHMKPLTVTKEELEAQPVTIREY